MPAELKSNGNFGYSYIIEDVPKGWVCPKCDRVFSPYQSECKYCNIKGTLTTTNNFTIRAGDDSRNE